MNRHTIPPQTNPPYTNGHYETPLEPSGVSLHRPTPVHKPTVFPPELPLRALGPTLYGLSRFQFGGVPSTRYLTILWFALAILAFLGALPGRWLTIALALTLWLGQTFLIARWQVKQFVDFTPTPQPQLNEASLEPHEKLPIYATGLLSVEGQYRTFSVVPGYYRTFESGEHAVMCHIQASKWLALGTLPPEELGMWYAFVNPEDIEQLTWGNLHFGPTTLPGLAIQYRMEIPAGPRRKKPEIRHELLYLASPEPQVAQRLYVDLLNNLPVHKVTASQSAHN